MKAVILAGGLGTRLSEVTNLIPKPIYSYYGINDFIICCGYKHYVIKEYFANYFRHNSDMTVDLSTNSIQIHDNYSEHWKVTLIDTGLNTMTGGRIKRIQSYVGNETFCLTYGDGVADINVAKTIELHRKAGKTLTITAFQPGGRLGVLDISPDGTLQSFIEKPEDTGTWINAGFFVCEPGIFDVLDNDMEMFEKEPMQRLVLQKRIHVYKHTGFWKPMDTLRDNTELNDMWNKGVAPWKMW